MFGKFLWISRFSSRSCGLICFFLLVNEEKLIQQIFLLTTKYVESEVLVLPLTKQKTTRRGKKIYICSSLLKFLKIYSKLHPVLTFFYYICSDPDENLSRLILSFLLQIRYVFFNCLQKSSQSTAKKWKNKLLP